MSDFSPMSATEGDVFTVDFRQILPPGVTIATASWSISLVKGSNPEAAAMIIGEASVSGTKVSQKISGGGIPGLIYAPRCTAVCSDGLPRVLPEYGSGHLYITP